MKLAKRRLGAKMTFYCFLVRLFAPNRDRDRSLLRMNELKCCPLDLRHFNKMRDRSLSQFRQYILVRVREHILYRHRPTLNYPTQVLGPAP